jgi:hypothetical protein
LISGVLLYASLWFLVLRNCTALVWTAQPWWLMMQEGRLRNLIVHSVKEPFVSSVWFLGIHIFAANFRNWKRKGKMLCWRILPRGKCGGGVHCARTVLKNHLVSSIWSASVFVFCSSFNTQKGLENSPYYHLIIAFSYFSLGWIFFFWFCFYMGYWLANQCHYSRCVIMHWTCSIKLKETKKYGVFTIASSLSFFLHPFTFHFFILLK